MVITSICFTGCKHTETGQEDVLKEKEDNQQADTAQEAEEVPEEVFIAVDRHWAGPEFEGGAATGTCVYEPLIFLNEKLLNRRQRTLIIISIDIDNFFVNKSNSKRIFFYMCRII